MALFVPLTRVLWAEGSPASRFQPSPIWLHWVAPAEHPERGLRPRGPDRRLKEEQSVGRNQSTRLAGGSESRTRPRLRQPVRHILHSFEGMRRKPQFCTILLQARLESVRCTRSVGCRWAAAMITTLAIQFCVEFLRNSCYAEEQQHRGPQDPHEGPHRALSPIRFAASVNARARVPPPGRSMEGGKSEEGGW